MLVGPLCRFRVGRWGHFLHPVLPWGGTSLEGDTPTGEPLPGLSGAALRSPLKVDPASSSDPRFGWGRSRCHCP